MDNEPRKASDVLLEIENTVKEILKEVRTQDLNVKIISNKLNLLMETLAKKPSTPPTVEAVSAQSNKVNLQHATMQQIALLNDERQVPILSDDKLPVENSPSGFRRVSRPESYSGDDAYLKKPNIDSPKLPMQMPQPPMQMQPPPGRSSNDTIFTNFPAPKETVPQPVTIIQNAIPVEQRIVDKNGKSVFMAEIEINSLPNMESVYKTRTNGSGKWAASLPIGEYRVNIRKRESLTKEKVEIGQNIKVDGSVTPLQLQTMIIKS